MSSSSVPHDTLDQIYDEIIEHMKISGAFDDVRVNLMDPIWSDAKFKDVIDKFELECERFCYDVDLNQHRNSLRAKLATKIDGYSSTGRLLKTHIDRLLRERNDEIKSKYYKHAKDFLKKFLPESKPNSKDETTENLKLESEQNSKQELPANTDEDLDVDMDVDMDIGSSSSVVGEEDDDDIERPAYSPIGTKSDEEKEEGKVKEDDKKDEVFEEDKVGQVKTEKKSSDESKCMEIDKVKKREGGNVEDSGEDKVNDNENDELGDQRRELLEIGYPIPPEDEIPLPPDDNCQPNKTNDLDEMTFSPVSSVCTADLSDFDYSIKLSDDEANQVGLESSKVPFEVIQGQLNDLETNVKSHKEPAQPALPVERIEIAEPTEASESDGGFSENTTSGRRVTRMRKSNPRYSNDLFKLL